MRQDAWTDLVKKLNLDLSQPIIPISADDIKRVIQEEPRILMYIDEREKLPDLLKQYGVFPLPVRNKQYILVHGEGFHDFEPINKPPIVFKSQLPFPLETTKGVVGEDTFLLLALNTGIISEFTKEPIHYLTRIGRSYLTKINFCVDDSPEIVAESVQFQVDLLLETTDQIFIIEGKTKQRSSFNIRQLYYPYRHWKETTAKRVRPIFFIYNLKHNLYHFWEYTFTDDQDYSSIKLVNSAIYRIEDEQMGLDEFLKITTIPKIHQVPQANDVSKIQELIVQIPLGYDTSAKIAKQLGFKTRQSSYYGEAAEMLGFVTLGKDHRYRLTPLGKEYVQSSPNKRNQLFARQLLRHPLMNRILHLLASKTKNEISIHLIISIIRERSKLTGTTPARRASTIISWFKWLANTMGIVTVEDNVVRIPKHVQIDAYTL